MSYLQYVICKRLYTDYIGSSTKASKLVGTNRVVFVFVITSKGFQKPVVILPPPPLIAGLHLSPGTCRWQLLQLQNSRSWAAYVSWHLSEAATPVAILCLGPASVSWHLSKVATPVLLYIGVYVSSLVVVIWVFKFPVLLASIRCCHPSQPFVGRAARSCSNTRL